MLGAAAAAGELTIRIDPRAVAPYIAGHEGVITGRRFFSVPSPWPAPRAGTHARSRVAIAFPLPPGPRHFTSDNLSRIRPDARYQRKG